MSIKLFADRAYLPPDAPHAEILYPFWGARMEKHFWRNDKRFDRYIEVGSTFFKLVDTPVDADFAVLPADWKFYVARGAVNIALAFAHKMSTVGKPVLVFLREDIDTPIPIENAYIFRSSLYRSTRAQNEFALPAYTGDFLEQYLGKKLPIRKKDRVPSVAFCGYTYDARNWKSNLKGAIRRSVKRLSGVTTPIPPHLKLRERALTTLRRHHKIKTDFIIRRGWYGGQDVRGDGTDENAVRVARQEYISNLVGSDYALVVRGAGNYSFRFYEALSVGRIPLIIDTDCVMPFDFAYEWRRCGVWVDVSEIDQIGERLVEFHASIDDQKFIALQYECRQLYKEWVSPDGFFKNLGRHFTVEHHFEGAASHLIKK